MTIRTRIGSWRLIFLTLVALVGFAASVPAVRAQVQPVATSTSEAAPIPETQIPADVTAAINSPERPEPPTRRSTRDASRIRFWRSTESSRG